MKIKKFTTLLVGVFLLVSMYSAGNSAAAVVPQQDTFSVGIVYSTGGLNDLSFNDAAKRAIDSALANHGSALTVAESCEQDCTIPDITAALDVMGDSDLYDLIIGIGFSSAEGVKASAEEHTDTKYMIIDSFVDLPNVSSIEFKEEEGSFLVGAMAAMVTKTNKLGFVGGLDIPLINRFAAGFEHGARSINPAITVTVTYIVSTANPFNDPVAGTTAGTAMLADGIDIIFAAAGGSGTGVIIAVDDQNDVGTGDKVYAIGVDSDQDYLAQGSVLASMIKKVDVATEGDIDALIAGTWSAGGVKLGIADNGVDISPMTYTQAEAFADYEGQPRLKTVFEFRQQIEDGNIVVAEFIADVDAALATTTDALSGSVDFNTVSGGGTSTTEDSPIAFFQVLFALFFIPVIARKFKK